MLKEIPKIKIKSETVVLRLIKDEDLQCSTLFFFTLDTQVLFNICPGHVVSLTWST